MALCYNHWQCESCNRCNELFLNQCATCGSIQEFNDHAKWTLIQLMQKNSSQLLWNKLPIDAFDIASIAQALTNKVYKIEINQKYWNKLTNHRYRKAILRIFNPRNHLSSNQLASVYKSFENSNLGPSVYSYFDIGQIEEFIDGIKVTDNQLLHNDILLTKTADSLSKIHQFKPTSFNPDKCEFIDKLLSNIDIANNIFNNKIKVKYIKKWEFILKYNSKYNEILFRDIMQKEFIWLINRIESSKAFINDLVFSHNDCHSENMILQKDNLKIIDYDYCGYNYRCYDFGNFFNELMIDNYYDKSPGFNINENNYPSLKYRKTFVSKYLNINNTDNDAILLSYVNGIEYGTLLSHLYWGMWGIIESERESVGWDYMEYGRQRLVQYYRIKSLIKSQSLKRVSSKL